MSRPVLSVVVPSYNGRHLLEPCLSSIERHRPGGVPIEVIVVDDASTDGTADWLRTTYPHNRLVSRAINGGFVAAANAGIEAARGEFIQLLNNDTEVEAGWVEAGLRPFANPDVGSVAPLVLMRDDPGRVDSAGDTYALIGWPSKRGHGQPADAWIGRRDEPVLGASGSSAIYRATALEQAGCFDPIYGSYYEDVDIAFRLRWAGFECVFAPGCRVLHEVSASYDHDRPALQRRMARNAEVLFWTNLPIGWLIAGLLPHGGFLVAQGLLRLASGRFRPWLLGKLDTLSLLPSIAGRAIRRRELAHRAGRTPTFPIRLFPLREARDHVRRPKPSASAPDTARRGRGVVPRVTGRQPWGGL